MFGSRKDWFHHELSFHRREWLCLGDCPETFGSEAQFKEHLQRSHGYVSTDPQLSVLVQACQQRIGPESSSLCSFCGDSMIGRYEIEHHIARHLKDLALWSLPQTDTSVEEGEEGSEINDDSVEEMKDAAEVVSSPTHSQEHSEINFVVDQVSHYRLPWKSLVKYLEKVFGPDVANLEPELVCKGASLVSRVVLTWKENKMKPDYYNLRLPRLLTEVR
jgi:hypothetical protein